MQGLASIPTSRIGACVTKLFCSDSIVLYRSMIAGQLATHNHAVMADWKLLCRHAVLKVLLWTEIIEVAWFGDGLTPATERYGQRRKNFFLGDFCKLDAGEVYAQPKMYAGTDAARPGRTVFHHYRAPHHEQDLCELLESWKTKFGARCHTRPRIYNVTSVRPLNWTVR